MSVLHDVHSEAHKLDVFGSIGSIVIYPVYRDVSHGFLTLSFAVLYVGHLDASDSTESFLFIITEGGTVIF